MITTEGFRDVVEIRDGTKHEVWDAYADVAPPYIRRRDRFEVRERVDYAGRVVEPLDEAGARAVARLLEKRGYESVAICFLNAYMNPANERRMRELLEGHLPDGTFLCTSSEVLPEMFEHPRFSTTMINAVTGPVVGRYIVDLDRALAARGYRGDLLILHSGGGVLTAKGASRYAAAPGQLRDRGGRHRRWPHRAPVWLRQRHQPRHGWHEHGHLAMTATSCAPCRAGRSSTAIP